MPRAIPIRPRLAVAGKCSLGKPRALKGLKGKGRADRSSGPSPYPYSPSLEGVFSEVRLNGVLRTSHKACSAKFALRSSHLAYKDSPFRVCYVTHKPATLQSPRRVCSMSLHKEICSVASTDLSPSLRTRQQMARVATIALVGVAYFAVIIVVLHFLRPDLNLIRRPTSEYAVGRYGFLMTSAFFSMSLGSFALVIGLYRGVSQRARSGIGLGLLGIWAVGVLIDELPDRPGRCSA